MPELIQYHVPESTNDPFPWQDDALCAQIDPDLFFPESGDWLAARQAKEICAACPVAEQCLGVGMRFNYGIFGGLTPSQRREIGGAKW